MSRSITTIKEKKGSHISIKAEEFTPANGLAQSETEKVHKLGQMELSTLVNGVITKHAVMDASNISMVIFSLENGNTIKQTDLACISIVMVASI